LDFFRVTEQHEGNESFARLRQLYDSGVRTRPKSVVTPGLEEQKFLVCLAMSCSSLLSQLLNKGFKSHERGGIYWIQSNDRGRSSPPRLKGSPEFHCIDAVNQVVELFKQILFLDAYLHLTQGLPVEPLK
jgi:hypothetical protein